jgi:hypothetical protein
MKPRKTEKEDKGSLLIIDVRSEADRGFDAICRYANLAIRTFDETGVLQGRHIGMDTPILPPEGARQSAHRLFRMAMKVTEQAVALPGKERGQPFPTLERQNPPRRGATTLLGLLPGGKEITADVFRPPADDDFDGLGHPPVAYDK